MGSKTKPQCEYEENACSSCGDIIWKPLGQSDCRTSEKVGQTCQYASYIWKALKLKFHGEFQGNPCSGSKDIDEKPLNQSNASFKCKIRSNVLLCKWVMKVAKMKLQCKYEENPARYFMRECSETSQSITSNENRWCHECKIRSNIIACKKHLIRSKMKLQYEYEENACSGSGDIVRKPLGEAFYITTNKMIQETNYGKLFLENLIICTHFKYAVHPCSSFWDISPDGWTDGQMDGRRYFIVPLPQLKVVGWGTKTDVSPMHNVTFSLTDMAGIRVLYIIWEEYLYQDCDLDLWLARSWALHIRPIRRIPVPSFIKIPSGITKLWTGHNLKFDLSWLWPWPLTDRVESWVLHIRSMRTIPVPLF